MEAFSPIVVDFLCHLLPVLFGHAHKNEVSQQDGFFIQLVCRTDTNAYVGISLNQKHEKFVKQWLNKNIILNVLTPIENCS